MMRERSVPPPRDIAQPQRFITSGQTITSILPLLTGFVVVGGFVVVQTYLARYTRIFAYSISIGQYLAAGFNLLVFDPLPSLLAIIVGAVLAALIVAILVWGTSVIRQPLDQRPRFREVLFRQFKGSISLNLLIGAIAALVVGLSYGPSGYAASPRKFGGGEPVDVVLIFKDDIPPVNGLSPRFGQSDARRKSSCCLS